jgi:hypothetical protein
MSQVQFALQGAADLLARFAGVDSVDAPRFPCLSFPLRALLPLGFFRFVESAADGGCGADAISPSSVPSL